MALDFPCGSGTVAEAGCEVDQAASFLAAAPAPCIAPQPCMSGPVRHTVYAMPKKRKVSSARVFNGESEGRGLFTNLSGVPSTTPAQ